MRTRVRLSYFRTRDETRRPPFAFNCPAPVTADSPSIPGHSTMFKRALVFALLFGFLSLQAVGCGGEDGPGAPATTDEVPTSEEPPPGEEEPLAPADGP